MNDDAPESQRRGGTSTSQLLILWAAPVGAAIAIPTNFFAGFAVMAIVLSVLLIAWLVALLLVSRTE
ncbi:hypothetical protein [Arthrobacter sp. H5]|uniref:hypothetical protein n=1 Tax=Arthrobacter sp. H5 TaxID=1267973 RepID=UPI0004854E3C|nr:hypothetical protein [Arthrobacter sp. H5]